MSAPAKSRCYGTVHLFSFCWDFMGLIIAQNRKLGGRYLEISHRLNDIHSNLYHLPLPRVAPRQVGFHWPFWEKSWLVPGSWKQEGTPKATRHLPKRIRTLLIVGKQIDAAHCKWVLFAHHQVLSARPSGSCCRTAWQQMGSGDGSSTEVIKWRFVSNCLSLRPLGNSD